MNTSQAPSELRAVQQAGMWQAGMCVAGAVRAAGSAAGGHGAGDRRAGGRARQRRGQCSRMMARFWRRHAPAIVCHARELVNEPEYFDLDAVIGCQEAGVHHDLLACRRGEAGRACRLGVCVCGGGGLG